MSRIYEMCNDIDSKDLLQEKEQLTGAEKERLVDFMKREGILSESGKKKRRNIGRTVGWAAAAAALVLVVVPNVSANAAYAMEQIPILGKVIKVVTIRNYQFENENYSADIQEVKLEQGNRAENAGMEGAETENSIQTINESIEEMTDRLIARFEEQKELEGGHGSIDTTHEVITDTDTWFTLRINVTETAASGYQYQYYYHIDKTTGEIASLKNLFQEGADYITPISENIKEQMRKEMQADESKIYWIDSEDEIVEQFDAIKEDQNFYLNEDGQIVICFDEYEVAPGYMGLVEFVVDEEAVAGIR
ncbi:MAG: RsiV family protein [Lachnospiraceae bacterium]|nr:RsiV family protein [Lachnospiraceae bacterium]